MADADKNILITPQVGGTSNPTIVFTGADNNPVTLRVLDDGTLSIEGSSGQLFSVSDSLTGTIFSVNDISGIPSIEVLSDGTVKLAEFGGTVEIGTNTVWHAGNDGSGSGLDADLLDGYHASSFVLKNTSYEWTSGQLTFRSADVMETSSGDQATLEVYQDTAGADAFMQFHVGSDYAAYFGLKGDINDFAVGGWSMGNAYYRVWHAGNDGSGSGLDADLLDGLELHTGRNNEANKVVRTDASGYLQTGWINTTSGATTTTLDRIYASNDGYVRYVTPTTFRTQITDPYYVSKTNGTVTTASTSSNVVRNITMSTSAPTGGNDGDVWMVYS